MSKEVDQRVVEMRFDNQRFEENVKTSMSTLNKLKNALKFDGATKGLENIEKTSDKIKLSALTEAAETVKVKFSAMEVVAITAMSRITNAAIDAGSKIVKSLTVDNIATGFEKYTTKTENVQTLVNSTGKSVAEIEKYLEKLMWYSDETSYGFTDMTSALATMSSSGGDIEKIIPLMMGVANATAFAGKGAAEFSQIMQYSISQAYSARYMQLQDWQTIESRTVNSKQLVEALILSGEQLGRIQKGTVTIENFRESLKKKWVDREVMEEAFGSFSKVTDEIYKGIQNGAFNDYAEGLEKIGTKFGETQYRAAASAQEAKSYKEAMDAIKDGISSQWSQMFQAIFGGYDQAKKLWTNFYYFLYEVFQKPIETLAEKVKDIMEHNPYTTLLKKLESVKNTVETITTAVVDYDSVVKKILNGEFGNGKDRFDRLTKAGYDWAYAQNLVNEKLGDSTRHATSYVATQQTMAKQFVELSDAKLKEIGLTDEEIKMYRSLEEQSKKTGKSISELVEDMKLKDGRSLLLGAFGNIGETILAVINSIREAWSDVFSFDVIKIYGILDSFNKFTEKLIPTEKAAEQLKTTFKGLFDMLDLGFKIINAPFTILKTIIVETAKNLDITLLDITSKIGSLLSKFHDWVLNNGFIAKGVRVIAKVLSETIRIVSKWINELMKSEKARKSINSLFLIFKTLGGIVYDILVKLYDTTSKWFDKIKESETGSKILEKIRDAFSKVANGILFVTEKTLDWLQAFRTTMKEHGVLVTLSKTFEKLGLFVSKVATATWNWGKSLVNSERGRKVLSILSTIFKAIWERLKDIFDITVKWIDAFIHSDAFKNALDFIFNGFNKMWEIGKNIFVGLKNGLENESGGVLGFIKNIAVKILETFKKVLGIHSPSKEFYDAGANCMIGFVNGLSDFFKGVIIGVTRLFNQLTTFMINIDWKKIFSIGISVATILFIKNVLNITSTLVDAINNFSKPAASFAKLMDSFTENLKNFGKAAKITAKSEFIKSFAKAILILSASIFILTQIPSDKLWNAVGVIAVLGAIMGGLMLLTNKIVDDEKLLQVKDVIITFIGLSASLLLASSALKKLASIDGDKIGSVLLLFSVMVGGLSLLMFSSKFISDPKNIKTIKSMTNLLFSLVGTITIFAIVTRILSKMSPSELDNAAVGLSMISSMILALVLVTSVFVKNGGTIIGDTLLKISACFGILTIVAKLISSMSWDDMGKAAAGLTGLVGIVTLLMLVVKELGTGRKSETLYKVLIGIAVCMGVLTFIAKLISSMSWGEMGKAAIGLVGLVGVVTLLMLAVKLVGGAKGSKNLGLTLMGIAMVMAALAAVAIILGLIDTKNLIKGVAATSVLVAMMALLVHSLKGVTDARYAMAAMTSVIVAIAASALVLSFINPGKLYSAVGGISVLLGMVALVMRTTKGLGPKKLGPLIAITAMIAILSAAVIVLASITDWQSALSAAGALTLVLLACVGVLYICKSFSKSDIEKAKNGALGILMLIIPLLGIAFALRIVGDTQNAIQNAMSLVVLISTLTLVVEALTKFPVDIKNASLGALALTAMVVPLLALVGVLVFANNIQNGINNAIALVTLATVLTILLIPLMVIGSEMITGIGAYGVGLGIIALTAMAVPLLALVGVLAVMNEVNNAKENSLILTELLTVLVGALAVLAILGPFALIGEKALIMLIRIIATVGTLTIAIGALFEKFPSLEKFIDKGLPILEKLSTGLGRVLGGFIKGALSATFEALPALGLQLSLFMLNLTPFIVGAKLLDDGVSKGIKSLASALLILTGANLVNQLTGWLTGGNDLSKFGEQLIPLGESVNKFAEATAGIDGKNVQAAAKAGEALAKMASEIPNSGGWIGAIMGENDADKFGVKMESFGESLASFASTTESVDGEKVKGAAKAGKALAKMASEIPNSGGWIGAIMGENDADKFGVKIAAFGKALVAFYKQAKKIDDYTIIENATKAGKALAKFADDIPNTGGLVSWFTGDNDFETFGKQLASYGKSLVSYYNEIKDIGPEAYESISNSVLVTKELIKMSDGIENIGGLVSWFTGDNDLATFGENLVSFGKTLTEYSKIVNDENVSKLSDVNSQVKELISVAKSIADVNFKSVSKFGSALESLAKDGIKKFKVAFNDSVNDVVKSVDKFIGSVASNSKSSSNKNKFKKVAEYFIGGLKSGFSVSKSFKNSLNSFAGNIASSMKNKTNLSAFHSTGGYFVNGLINGINDNAYRVKAPASKVAEQAVKALNNKLQVRSPSRVTYGIGKYTVMGFVNALNNYSNDAFAAGANIAESAKNGINSAIETAKNLLDGEISDQPTIRPVLDLSNIESGARYIDNIFSNEQALAVAAEGSIGNQNGISGITVNMTINGAPGQDINQLADIVSQKLNDSIRRRVNVWK